MYSFKIFKKTFFTSKITKMGIPAFSKKILQKIDPGKEDVIDSFFYALFLIFCALLPFQFALNPVSGIDLAVVRVYLPLLLLGYTFFVAKKDFLVIFKNKLSVTIIIFLLFTSFSLFFSHNLSWSLRKIGFLYSLFPAYFLALCLLTTPIRKRLAIIALVLGASILALLGISQFILQFIFGINTIYAFMATYCAPFFLGHSFSQAVLTYPSWLVNSNGITYMRASAIFPDPHMFSYYLGMLIPWSLALWATSTHYKKLFFSSALLLLFADIFSFTRGGYIALIAGAVIALPFVSRKVANKIVLGICIIIFLFFIAPHNPVASRLTSSFDPLEGSNQGRLNNWQQALVIIKNNPLGVGVGSYSLAVKPTAQYREPIYAHNVYLDIASELGIQTVALFIFLLYTASRNFFLLSKNTPFFLAGISSLTIFSVHSLVENPMYSVHVLPLFLIILALSATAYEKIRHSI
jgi:O-antigen ligase